MYQYFSDFEDVLFFFFFFKRKQIRGKRGIILTASIQGIQDKHPGEKRR